MIKSPLFNTSLVDPLIDKLYEGNSTEIKGYRVNHAKGIVLSGSFIPSKQAASISRAMHFSETTPVLARLSNSTGLPNIEDQNPKANPRGIAIQFQLKSQQITDIVGHSVEGFPVDTPEEFIKFLSVANKAETNLDHFLNYIDSHAASKRFFSLLTKIPQSFAETPFYPLHAFKFINHEQNVIVGRYQIQPLQGVKYLNEDQLKMKGNNFLREELIATLKLKPIEYRLVLQIAKPEDDLMHISQPWSGEHEMIDLGIISLNQIVEKQTLINQSLAFDPTRLIDGIESVDDPMFAIRSPAYRLSVAKRGR